MDSTDLAADYDAWHAAWTIAAERVMDATDKLRDDTLDYARAQTARHKRRPTPATKRAADDAWARVRRLDPHLDPIGAPIDPRYAGRAKFEHAWLLATGMPWTHPHDDDTPPEHAAGEHEGTTLRRSYAGDLPACGACMDDEDWADNWTYTVRPRKARR